VGGVIISAHGSPGRGASLLLTSSFSRAAFSPFLVFCLSPCSPSSDALDEFLFSDEEEPGAELQASRSHRGEMPPLKVFFIGALSFEDSVTVYLFYSAVVPSLKGLGRLRGNIDRAYQANPCATPAGLQFIELLVRGKPMYGKHLLSPKSVRQFIYLRPLSGAQITP